MSKTHTKHPHKAPAKKQRSDGGWTMPVDTLTLREWIATTEEELVKMKNELHNREHAGRLEAIATVHNIQQIWEMLGQPIKLSEICTPSGRAKK